MKHSGQSTEPKFRALAQLTLLPNFDLALACRPCMQSDKLMHGEKQEQVQRKRGIAGPR